MCGIAGSINFKLDIPVLTKVLFHRGPDEQTTFEEHNLQLHHHRLSILDIACGKQPMHHEHLTIIFNGEIYNHRSVRSKLNLDCTTNSDTETILKAYIAKGPACLHEFDGMFALAIFDRNKNTLFLARDRAGKKPLYYFMEGDRFIFASELNSIRSQVSLQLNAQHLHNYVRMGYFHGSDTPYQNVWELPAGSYAYVSLHEPVVKITKWWDIFPVYQKRSADDLETALNNVNSILHEAVKSRIESSDLEVGSFLSGGIDSGIVTAIASQYNSSLKTFTVSFPGEYDEAPLARTVSEKYHTNHHEISVTFDHLLGDVEKILSNYGEPHYDESAIPSYYVSKEAKKHLTVILNGDGGDELFGGYRRYVPFAKIDFFRHAPLRSKLFGALHSLLPNSQSKMGKLNYLKRMFFLGSRTGFDTYLAATTDIFEGYEKDALMQAWTPGDSLSSEFEKVFQSELTGLQKLMLLDFNNILPSLLLVKMDIATMAHSLEGRSPLLSKMLLEYIPTLSDQLKINGTTTKHLLRKLAARYLPEQLITQPKRGFEPPLKHWIEHELHDMIGDYLTSGSALYPVFIRREFARNLFDKKMNVSPEKRAKMLWMIFSLEVWHRKVYKNQ